MKDLMNNIAVTQPLNPVTSTTTKTSSSVDLQGYNSATVVFAVGQSGDTLSGSVYWTLKVQHSDDDSVYTDTAASDLLNPSLTTVVDSSAKDRQAYKFGYVGAKRYLKGVATPTGTHTNGTPLGILAVRGTPAQTPA